jgi:hypothetical protein
VNRRQNRYDRHREIEASIKRAILERAGRLATHNAERAKVTANLADDVASDVRESLLRDWSIREKPRGSRVVS